ncbi:hypothetical protein CFP56_011752 [Quercus suber]|uniref:Uncharacterized protein n=1 Tax=Quercus suber TaxID=58331 RepID=A0AAW0KZJ5_QUESU
MEQEDGAAAAAPSTFSIKHPLLFLQDYRGGRPCCRCQESVYGPSYYCLECSGILGRALKRYTAIHHKSCAEVPLGCTIPCTQSILSFSLMKRHIILKKKKNTNKRPNAKSAMNLADNTLIAVTAATSTFTPHVLPYRPPSNLLKSTTTH